MSSGLSCQKPALAPFRERRVADLLDPVQDLVARREEVLLDADVGVIEVALVAVRQVSGRRPHEVTAEAVDVVRELDVVERVGDPELVLDLRLRRLPRARVDLAGARVRRADVAVEDRPHGVVAVHVGAPGVALLRVDLCVRTRPWRGWSAAARSPPRTDRPVSFPPMTQWFVMFFR